MKNLLTILFLIISIGCFSQSFQPRSNGSFTPVDYRLAARDNFYVAYNLTDTSLNGGKDTLGAMVHVRSGALQGLWYRDSVSTGGHHWARVAGTTETYWTLNGTDLYPNSASYDVGIGTTNPAYKLDVVSSNGELYFDGTRLGLYDASTRNNILIGALTGASLSTTYKNNIAIGFSASRYSTGDNNIAIGTSALQNANNANNTAIGYQSLYLTDSLDNTAVGYTAGILNNGTQNISIGSGSGNYFELGNAALNNSEIVIGTSNYVGTTTAAFITAQSLVVGSKYQFSLLFNGTAPQPYLTSGITGLKVSGTVTASNTIHLENASTFTTQGTSTTTFRIYNKQNNSIAIGYNAISTQSNQIMLGTSSNTVLQANQFVVDLTDVPTNGQVLTWHSGLGKAQWDTVTTGGGSGISSVTLPLVFSGGNLSINNATTSTSGVVTPNASDFNLSGSALTIDYTNGQAATTTLKGFLTSTDWNTFNGKVSTGAITSSGLTMATARLLGRTTASTGAIEEISIGSGLSMVGGVLSSSGGGITSLNGLTGATQIFAIGSTGTSPNWISSGTIHSLNIPTTNATNTGLVTPSLYNTWNAKQDAITGAATTIVSSNLTVSRAAISNASGKIDVSAVTSTELGYLSGVTSSIQTQLNSLNNYTFGTLTDAANITWDYSTGFNKQLTIGGNRNISITNMSDGQDATIFITQDATGSRTITFPAGTLLLDGIGTSPTVTLTATPNALNILSIKKRGSVLYVTMGYFH